VCHTIIDRLVCNCVSYKSSATNRFYSWLFVFFSQLTASFFRHSLNLQSSCTFSWHIGEWSRSIILTKDLRNGHICMYQLLRFKQGPLQVLALPLLSADDLKQVLIYGFLVEKVYIVWSGGNQTPRFSTPAYRICSVVLLGYVTVLVLMILGQNSLIRGDGMCIIGLKNFAYV
jgi:hypothetical protein